MSLSLATGRDDGYLNLHVSGRYVFPGADHNRTAVYNQQLSPHGSQVLAEGTFTRVQGKARQQIFMLNLGRRGDVSDWYSAEFSRFCAASHPFYVKAAAWSPDGSCCRRSLNDFRSAAEVLNSSCAFAVWPSFAKTCPRA